MADSKLRNIDAIKDILQGEHKSQTRKVISLSDSDKQKEKKEEVKDTRADKFRKLRDKYNVKTKCPECGKLLTKWQDIKFVKMTNKCFSCKVNEDTELIIEDRFDEYQYNFMYNNLTKFLDDARKDVDILKDIFSKAEYVNEDGTVEEWDIPYSVDEMKDKIENDFVKLKEDLLKMYSDYLNDIKNKK